MNRPSKRLVALALLVAALSLLPVVYLVVRAAQAGGEAWGIFLRPGVWRVFGNSAALAAVTTRAPIALGVPLAWLTARTDLPLRRFWSVVLILPLAMPSYIAAYAFIALLAHRAPWLYGLPGTAAVITMINFPFVVLTVRAALQRMDPSIEEAAQGLGCPQSRVFWRVTLPHLRPSITSGRAAGGAVFAERFRFAGADAVQCLHAGDLHAVSRVVRPEHGGADGAAAGRADAADPERGDGAAGALAAGPLLLDGGAAAETRGAGADEVARFRILRGVATATLAVPIGVIVYWTARGVIEPPAVESFVGAGAELAAGFGAGGGAAVLAALPVVVLAVRYRGRAVRCSTG
jgi:iron(III) transport system permease protein